MGATSRNKRAIRAAGSKSTPEGGRFCTEGRICPGVATSSYYGQMNSALQSDGNSQTVLMVVARDPSGRMTGRKNVLATALRGLAAAGASVHVAALTRNDGPDQWLNCPVTRIVPPALAATAVSLVKSGVAGRSFNEALYDTGAVRRSVISLADRINATVVVADTLRAWNAAAGTGRPVIAHLDDLLSERYAAARAGGGEVSLLGYYGAELPRQLLRPAESAARRLLSVEARRSGIREDHVARTASFTALTGVGEAERLSARSGVHVSAIPMAVDVLDPGRPELAAPNTAVFLGGLDYSPNLVAVRWWRDHVAPILAARGFDVRLSVVGFADSQHRQEFARSKVELLGYATDLRDSLSRHRMFVAPIQSGAGVKTKVLDAMSVGLPVLGTSLAVAGIGVADGLSALVADDPAEFAAKAIALMLDGELAARLGRAGRDVLTTQFSSGVIESKWSDALSAVGENQRRSDRRVLR